MTVTILLVRSAHKMGSHVNGCTDMCDTLGGLRSLQKGGRDGVRPCAELTFSVVSFILFPKKGSLLEIHPTPHIFFYKNRKIVEPLIHHQKNRLLPLTISFQMIQFQFLYWFLLRHVKSSCGIFCWTKP